MPHPTTTCHPPSSAGRWGHRRDRCPEGRGCREGLPEEDPETFRMLPVGAAAQLRYASPPKPLLPGQPPLGPILWLSWGPGTSHIPWPAIRAFVPSAPSALFTQSAAAPASPSEEIQVFPSVPHGEGCGRHPGATESGRTSPSLSCAPTPAMCPLILTAPISGGGAPASSAWSPFSHGSSGKNSLCPCSPEPAGAGVGGWHGLRPCNPGAGELEAGTRPSVEPGAGAGHSSRVHV